MFQEDLRSFFKGLRELFGGPEIVGDFRGVGLAVAIVIFFRGGEMFFDGFVEGMRLVEKNERTKGAFSQLKQGGLLFLSRGAEERMRFPGGFASWFKAGGAGHGPLGERQHGGANYRSDGALGTGVEFADGLDSVAEEFDADGALRFGREKIHDAAANRELAGEFDHFGAGVADGGEMSDEFFVRNFGVFAEGARERQIEVGIVVAPERGDDRGDDERDLAVGETEEGGGAAFENVRVRALRFPRESVEGGEDGDFSSDAGAGARLCRGKCWRKI